MKKAAIALIILLLCFSAAAQAQRISFGSRGAICPFKWEGDIWRTDLGTVLSQEIYKRIRSNRQIYYIPPDEVRRILAEARMENAWSADPEELRKFFWEKNVSLVVAGKIEELYFIRDADGTAYVDVKIQFKVISVQEASIIFTDTVEYRTKSKVYVTKDSPYNHEVALSILTKGANLIAGKLQIGLDRYFNQNRLRRIY